MPLTPVALPFQRPLAQSGDGMSRFPVTPLDGLHPIDADEDDRSSVLEVVPRTEHLAAAVHAAGRLCATASMRTMHSYQKTESLDALRTIMISMARLSRGLNISLQHAILSRMRELQMEFPPRAAPEDADGRHSPSLLDRHLEMDNLRLDGTYNGDDHEAAKNKGGAAPPSVFSTFDAPPGWRLEHLGEAAQQQHDNREQQSQPGERAQRLEEEEGGKGWCSNSNDGDGCSALISTPVATDGASTTPTTKRFVLPAAGKVDEEILRGIRAAPAATAAAAEIPEETAPALLGNGATGSASGSVDSMWRDSDGKGNEARSGPALHARRPTKPFVAQSSAAPPHGQLPQFAAYRPGSYCSGGGGGNAAAAGGIGEADGSSATSSKLVTSGTQTNSIATTSATTQSGRTSDSSAAAAAAAASERCTNRGANIELSARGPLSVSTASVVSTALGASRQPSMAITHGSASEPASAFARPAAAPGGACDGGAGVEGQQGEAKDARRGPAATSPAAAAAAAAAAGDGLRVCRSNAPPRLHYGLLLLRETMCEMGGAGRRAAADGEQFHVPTWRTADMSYTRQPSRAPCGASLRRAGVEGPGPGEAEGGAEDLMCYIGPQRTTSSNSLSPTRRSSQSVALSLMGSTTMNDLGAALSRTSVGGPQ